MIRKSACFVRVLNLALKNKLYHQRLLHWKYWHIGTWPYWICLLSNKFCSITITVSILKTVLFFSKTLKIKKWAGKFYWKHHFLMGMQVFLDNLHNILTLKLNLISSSPSAKWLNSRHMTTFLIATRLSPLYQIRNP